MTTVTESHQCKTCLFTNAITLFSTVNFDMVRHKSNHQTWFFLLDLNIDCPTIYLNDIKITIKECQFAHFLCYIAN